MLFDIAIQLLGSLMRRTQIGRSVHICLVSPRLVMPSLSAMIGYPKPNVQMIFSVKSS